MECGLIIGCPSSNKIMLSMSFHKHLKFLLLVATYITFHFSSLYQECVLIGEHTIL